MLVSIRGAVADRLLPIFESAHTCSTPIDVQDVLLRYTFDNICRIGFGVDPGCLDPSLPAIPFAVAFDEATRATQVRNVIPPPAWKFLNVFQLASEKSLSAAVKVIDEFAATVIAKRKTELAEGKGEHTHLLSRFMVLSSQSKDGMYSDDFLRDACTNFILAGRDTSSVALSWFFWLLTNHPEVEEKIVAEVNTILEKRKQGTRRARKGWSIG